MKTETNMTDNALKELAMTRANRVNGKTFAESEQAFAARFFTAAHERDAVRRQKRNRLFPYIATGIAALCAIACTMIFQENREGNGTRSAESGAARTENLDLYREAETIFGNDTGVLCVDDELVTFDRSETGAERQNYDVRIPGNNGREMRLRFAAAENETIAVDQDGIKGTILVISSDGSCDVVMIELARNGRKLNRMIVVKS